MMKINMVLRMTILMVKKDNDNGNNNYNNYDINYDDTLYDSDDNNDKGNNDDIFNLISHWPRLQGILQ